MQYLVLFVIREIDLNRSRKVLHSGHWLFGIPLRGWTSDINYD